MSDLKVCLYHSSDLDGHCSGAIYALAHERRNEDVVLHGIDYGDEVPWDLVADADVTLVDFSIQPWPEFCRLMQAAKSLLWIDHHKSAIETWEQSEALEGCCPTRVLLDVKFAGCELAWDYFFPDKPMPNAVKLLGRYGVWDHENPDVLPFQYGMRLERTDPSGSGRLWLWKQLFSDDGLKSLIDTGHTLLQYQSQNDAVAVKAAWFPAEFAGHKWQACNRLGKGSQFFKAVWSPSEFDGMMAFGWDGQKRRWVVGLYSDNPEMDCGAIAKKYGGGGHPGAAGFRCLGLPFQLQAQTKEKKR